PRGKDLSRPTFHLAQTNKTASTTESGVWQEPGSINPHNAPEADGDGEDAVVVARRDVVRVGVARQRQAAGERAVPELGAVLALGLVVPLGADGQVARADRDLHVLLRVDPGQLGPDHVVVTLDEVLDPDRLAQV